MKTRLKVSNLSVYFKSFSNKEPVVAVRNSSFTLEKNEVLGIVGESGSGKSVTALSLLGLLNYPKAYHGKGSSVCLDSQELIGADEKLLEKIRGKKVGFVFQEPMSSLNPLHKIGAQVLETLVLHGQADPKRGKAQVLELLNKVGLKKPELRYNAYPFELSGGERQRVMIAMAVANKPEVLILDEPTTALDVTIQAQIIKLIMDLKKQLLMSVIFISHDLALVAKISDRIIVMHQGKIVETGTPKQIFKSPKHTYTKKLISSIKLLKNNIKICKQKIVSVKNLSVVYPIKKNIFGKITRQLKALDDVSFDIYEGETLGIVGESGSGKTTLGHALTRLIKYQGQVDFASSMTEKEFRRAVQIIFQDPYNSLNPRLNVVQIIGEGLKTHHKDLTEEQIIEKVSSILQEVGLSKTALYKYPHEFSGGERQRIAIARALILNPKIVILDEPTSALDVTIQKQIILLLKDLQQKHKMTYIFISHDMRSVLAMSDRIAVMQSGKIVEIGRADKIFEHPQQEYTKTLISTSIF